MLFVWNIACYYYYFSVTIKNIILRFIPVPVEMDTMLTSIGFDLILRKQISNVPEALVRNLYKFRLC